MQRRDWLKWATLGTGAAFLAGRPPAGAQDPAPPTITPGTGAPPPPERNEDLKITEVRPILTAPAGIRLVVVKVLTNQPGLYGLGCATFTQRARAVETAVSHFLQPFLAGRNPLEIEDVWQASFVSSYWRNGPVLNNALSGVDMALWDILGKVAGQPLYRLLGGKCRRAVDTYRHASGGDLKEVEDSVRRYMDEGYRHIRVQMSVPGQATYGTRRVADAENVPENQRTRRSSRSPTH